MISRNAWLAAFYGLFTGVLATGALNMLRVRGGFLTNHAADVVVPAWLYVACRGLHSSQGRRTLIQRTIGHTPEVAVITLFAASAITEISQLYWPRGIFAGRFDVLDLVAYAGGLGLCYIADKWWTEHSEVAATTPRSTAV